MPKTPTVLPFGGPVLEKAGPNPFVRDSVITIKVKANLAEEEMSSLAHIKLDTSYKGAVALSGNVRTQAEADNAISIARDTEGVTSI